MIAVGVFRIVVLGEGATYGPQLEEQVEEHGRAADRDPDPARLRGRRRRLDRHGGDRHRRSGVPAARGEERGHDPGRHGRPARRPVHRHHVPGGQLRDRPDRASGQDHGHLAGGPAGVRRAGSRSTCSRPSRRCSCSSPRTRASTPSRACWRSSPATATCPASSRCAAIAWPTRTGSSSWPTLAAGLIIYFGGSTHALIPLYAVGVFIDFTISQTGMIRHWLRERSPGWRKRLSINAFGAALTATVAVVVTAVKFFDGAWLVLVLIPILVALMSFIHRQYELQEAELKVREDGLLPGPAPRAAGDHPGQRHQPGRRPGGQLRARARARPAGRLRHRRPRGRRRAPGALGASSCPDVPAGHRRVAVPRGDLAGRRLPRHPRPGLAARTRRRR